MPPQIPHPDLPIHLYRHLLREATYLPPLCRPWAADRIKARFRASRAAPHRAKLHIKDAHHELRNLRAANAGHTERMVKLLWHATGRLGKRRRQLATSQLRSDPAADSNALGVNTIQASGTGQVVYPGHAEPEPTAVIPGGMNHDNGNQGMQRLEDRTPDWLDNWSIPMLEALSRSQCGKQRSKWPLQMRRVVEPERSVPKVNCWGEPFSPKLVRRKHQKHWVGILKQLMPPLPQGEWEVLRDLATGRVQDDTWKIPPRRPVAISTQTQGVAGQDGQVWDWQRFAVRPIRSLEATNSRKRKVLSGGLDEDPQGQGRPIGVRAWKPRLLRRGLYSRVWEASPTMHKNANGNWIVRWGNDEPRTSAPSSIDMQFFQGVDKNGSPLRRR